MISMAVKKFTPANLDMETHAELVRRKQEGKGSLTAQVRELVLGKKEAAPKTEPAAPEAKPEETPLASA